MTYKLYQINFFVISDVKQQKNFFHNLHLIMFWMTNIYNFLFSNFNIEFLDQNKKLKVLIESKINENI